MSEDQPPSQLPSPRDLTRRAAGRAARALRQGATAVGRRIKDRAVDHLRDPSAVEHLQGHLVTLTNWSLNRAFRYDPNARLLFEFVDWHDQRHGRDTTASILLASPLVEDAQFLRSLFQMADWLDPRVAAHRAGVGPGELDRFKETTGNYLLRLLTDLAALHHPDSPDEAMTVDDHLDYLEEAHIPDRFKTLGPMTQGRFLRDPPTSSSPIGRLLQSLTTSPASQSLIPRNPVLHDKTLQFLVFSTALVIQSYLVRHIIETLPDLADELADGLQSTDIE